MPLEIDNLRFASELTYSAHVQWEYRRTGRLLYAGNWIYATPTCAPKETPSIALSVVLALRSTYEAKRGRSDSSIRAHAFNRRGLLVVNLKRHVFVDFAENMYQAAHAY